MWQVVEFQSKRQRVYAEGGVMSKKNDIKRARWWLDRLLAQRAEINKEIRKWRKVIKKEATDERHDKENL
jgi:hypothetical protein